MRFWRSVCYSWSVGLASQAGIEDCFRPTSLVFIVCHGCVEANRDYYRKRSQ